jgi:hypothetical protein
MKRYLIQSPLYNGSVEVIYNDGLLKTLDFTNCSMAKPEIINAFIKKITAEEQYLSSSFVSNVTIISAEVQITFMMFWNKYNHKINKLRATKLWERMTLAEQIEAYCGIQKYFEFLKIKGWRGLADPDTYLRNKYWTNEYK